MKIHEPHQAFAVVNNLGYNQGLTELTDNTAIESRLQRV